jgi:ankyrin repeat protein
MVLLCLLLLSLTKTLLSLFLSLTPCLSHLLSASLSSAGHVLTHDKNKHCVQRVANSTAAQVIPCDDGYVFLTLQCKALAHLYSTLLCTITAAADVALLCSVLLSVTLRVLTTNALYCPPVATSSELQWLSSGPGRLVAAAMDNDLSTARQLLEGGTDVNAVDRQDNMFPLLAAASQGHEDMALLLLSQSALDVNQAVTASSLGGVAGNGVTALMEASMKGSAVLVELLLARGAAVGTHTAEAYGGLTALWLAASQGDAAVVQLLLAAGADPSQARLADGITPLMAAAAGGHAGAAELLLQAGAEVDARDSDGVTAVLNVAESGDLRTLQLLLAADAAVNYMSSNNFSPLIVACAHGHYDVISALIDAGEYGVCVCVSLTQSLAALNSSLLLTCITFLLL